MEHPGELTGLRHRRRRGGRWRRRAGKSGGGWKLWALRPRRGSFEEIGELSALRRSGWRGGWAAALEHARKLAGLLPRICGRLRRPLRLGGAGRKWRLEHAGELAGALLSSGRRWRRGFGRLEGLGGCLRSRRLEHFGELARRRRFGSFRLGRWRRGLGRLECLRGLRGRRLEHPSEFTGRWRLGSLRLWGGLRCLEGLRGLRSRGLEHPGEFTGCWRFGSFCLGWWRFESLSGLRNWRCGRRGWGRRLGSFESLRGLRSRRLKHLRELAGLVRCGNRWRRPRFGRFESLRGLSSRRLKHLRELAGLVRGWGRYGRRRSGCNRGCRMTRDARRARRERRHLPHACHRGLDRRRRRRVLLIVEPFRQVLGRRRHRHHERSTLVVSHFDQLAHRLRWKGAQPRQQRFVRGRLAPYQQVNIHLPAGSSLLRSKAPGAFPRKRFDQFIFPIEIHMPPRPLLIMHGTALRYPQAPCYMAYATVIRTGL